MSKTHTPGPWEVNMQAHPHTEVFAGNFLICEAIGGQAHLGQVRDFKLDEANARLIATAPELLEAVKSYCSWGAMTSSDHEAFRRMEAATTAHRRPPCAPHQGECRARRQGFGTHGED